MDPASLVLAVIGTLDLCIKYGKEIVAICKKQSYIDQEIDDLILTIQGQWLKTEIQLESLKLLWDTLPPALQGHYEVALIRLQKKTETAWKSLGEVTDLKGTAPDVQRRFDPGLPVQRFKAVVFRKHIKKVVSDLEEWQARFDPSWYLITRIANPVVDKHLMSDSLSGDTPTSRLAQMRQAIKETAVVDDKDTRSIFVDGTVIEKELSQIPRSNTFLSSYCDDGRSVLLDQTDYPFDTPMNKVKPYVRDLARRLQNVDPMTFGLLRCQGVIELRHENDAIKQFQFIFEIPPEISSSPTTLRQLLMSTTKCPLNQRIQLAKQLARSVMFVHSAGFVHKNIRPETILIFPDSDKTLGPSFLTGFERIRPADAPTDLYGDLDWTRNLYRHPARQGLWPEELFMMQHDIYSLGVCLLEIGLWSSFVCQDGDQTIPWDELDISTAIQDKDHRRGASAIKKNLMVMAKDQLPCILGDKYTSLTIACLTCLDKGEENTFGSQKELRDKDGIIVGVRYAERILLKMDSISI